MNSDFTNIPENNENNDEAENNENIGIHEPEDEQVFTRPDPIRRNEGLEKASVLLGVFALFSTMIFYLSIPLGALAVITGLLSRGNGKVKGRGKTGIFIGVIALSVSIAFTGYTVALYMTNTEYRESVKNLVDYYMARYGLEPRGGADQDQTQGTGGGLAEMLQEMSEKAQRAQGESESAKPGQEQDNAPIQGNAPDDGSVPGGSNAPAAPDAPSSPAADVEGGIFT